MAVQGQRAKNVGVKKKKRNPTRTKVKTPNVSPQQVSRYKNDATKETSKAILKVQTVTGTGPRSKIRNVSISSRYGKLGKNYEAPRIKATATSGPGLRSTLRVVKRVRKK